MMNRDRLLAALRVADSVQARVRIGAGESDYLYVPVRAADVAAELADDPEWFTPEYPIAAQAWADGLGGANVLIGTDPTPG
jgi:hypothetical protein